MTAITRRALYAGALLPFVPTRARAATTWDGYVYNPVASVAAVQGVQRIIDTVREKTNGALVINLHLGGSLPINATNITQAVADGVVQFGDDGFATGNVPISAILRLPMLLQNDAELAKAMAILLPYLDDGLRQAGHRRARPVPVSVPGDLGPQEDHLARRHQGTEAARHLRGGGRVHPPFRRRRPDHGQPGCRRRAGSRRGGWRADRQLRRWHHLEGSAEIPLRVPDLLRELDLRGEPGRIRQAAAGDAADPARRGGRRRHLGHHRR